MKRCHWIPWHTSITSAQCIHRTSAASCMFSMRFSTLSIYLLLLCLTLCIIAVKPLMWISNCMLILTIIFCSIVSRLLSFFMQHFFNWIWLLALIGTVLEMACKGKLGKHTVCGVAFRWYPAVWKRVCSLLFGVKWLVPEKCKCKINLKWGVTGQMKTSGSVKWHNNIVTQLKMLMPASSRITIMPLSCMMLSCQYEPNSSKSLCIYLRNAEMIIWKTVLTRDHIIKELFRSICSITCKNSWDQKYLISNPLEIKYANLDWWNISASD